MNCKAHNSPACKVQLPKYDVLSGSTWRFAARVSMIYTWTKGQKTIFICERSSPGSGPS